MVKPFIFYDEISVFKIVKTPRGDMTHIFFPPLTLAESLIIIPEGDKFSNRCNLSKTYSNRSSIVEHRSTIKLPPHKYTDMHQCKHTHTHVKTNIIAL